MKKRIALSVVAALAGGLLAAVPASAVTTSTTLSTSSSSVQTGATFTATVGKQSSVSIYLSTDGGGTDLSADVTNTDFSAVSGTSATQLDSISATATANNQIGTYYLQAAADTGGKFTTDPVNNAGDTWIDFKANAALTRVKLATLHFTPDKAGTYVFTLGTDVGGGGNNAVTLSIVASNPTASSVAQGSVSRSDLADQIVISGLNAGLTGVNHVYYQVIGAPTKTGFTNPTGLTIATNQDMGVAKVNNWTFDTASVLKATPGTYTVRVYTDLNLDGVYSADQDSAATTLTFVIAADGAGAASLTLSKTSLVLDTNAAAASQKFAFSYTTTDSYGNESYLVSGNSWTVTNSAGKTSANDASVFAVEDGFINGDFADGTGVVEIPKTTAAGVYTIAVTGEGAGASAATGSTATLTITSVVSNGTAEQLKVDAASGLVFDTTSNGKLVAGATETGTITASRTAAKTITFKFSAGSYVAGTATQLPITLTILAGSLTDKTAPTYATILPDGTGTFTVTATAPASNDSYTVEIPSLGGGGTLTYTVTYKSNNPSFQAASKMPAAAFVAATGSTNVLSAVLDDTFGSVLASKTVTVTVAGRNPSTQNVTTDAAGKASFSLVDAGAVAAATTDTVTFSYAYISSAGTSAAATTSFVITYTATGIVVGTVGVSGANNVGGRVVDTQMFLGLANAGATETYTASVVDASGLPLNGVVVTWSADKDTMLAKTSSTTDASGLATVTAYRMKSGYGTVTATAGGKSGKNALTKWSAAPGTHRTVALAAAPATAQAGGVIRYTATLTDRWGNPISGVDLTLRLTGAGRLVTNEVPTVRTAIDGTAQWNVTTLSTEAGATTATVSVDPGFLGQTEEAADVVGAASVVGAAAGVSSATATGTFTAAAAAADPTVTALVTQVQSLIVSVNAIIASMTKSIAATNTQIAKLVAAIAKLTKKK